MTFITSKGEIHLKGSLVSLSADNLGSHFIGGFKGSCIATRPCRHCMVQYEDMKNQVSMCIQRAKVLEYLMHASNTHNTKIIRMCTVLISLDN